MAKYHINSAGEAGACKAVKGGCPFGGLDEHYTSAEAARKAFEDTKKVEVVESLSKALPRRPEVDGDLDPVTSKLIAAPAGTKVKQINESGGLSFYRKDEYGLWVRYGDYKEHIADELTGIIIFDEDRGF
jgi:hypothetical protein